MTAVKYMSHSHRFRTYSHPQAERKVGRVHKHEFSNNYRHNIMRQLRENILHLPTQTHVHIFWVPSLAHAFARYLHIHPITFWQITQVKTHRKHTFSILNYETISRKKVKTRTKCYTNARETGTDRRRHHVLVLKACRCYKIIYYKSVEYEKVCMLHLFVRNVSTLHKITQHVGW